MNTKDTHSRTYARVQDKKEKGVKGTRTFLTLAMLISLVFVLCVVSIPSSESDADGTTDVEVYMTAPAGSAIVAPTENPHFTIEYGSSEISSWIKGESGVNDWNSMQEYYSDENYEFVGLYSTSTFDDGTQVFGFNSLMLGNVTDYKSDGTWSNSSDTAKLYAKWVQRSDDYYDEDGTHWYFDLEKEFRTLNQEKLSKLLECENPPGTLNAGLWTFPDEYQRLLRSEDGSIPINTFSFIPQANGIFYYTVENYNSSTARSDGVYEDSAMKNANVTGERDQYYFSVQGIDGIGIYTTQIDTIYLTKSQFLRLLSPTDSSDANFSWLYGGGTTKDSNYDNRVAQLVDASGLSTEQIESIMTQGMVNASNGQYWPYSSILVCIGYNPGNTPTAILNYHLPDGSIYTETKIIDSGGVSDFWDGIADGYTLKMGWFSDEGRTTKQATITSSGTYDLYGYWLSDQAKEFFQIDEYTSKKVSVLGDSLSICKDTNWYRPSAAQPSTAQGGSTLEQMWWKQISTDADFTILNNNSIGATRTYTPPSGNDDDFLKDNRFAALKSQDGNTSPDIILFYGCNDFLIPAESQGLEMGTFDPNNVPDSAKGKVTTPTTVVDSYCILFHKMISELPDTQVIVAGSEDKLTYDFSTYRAELEKICTYFGFMYVDLSVATWSDGDYRDGLHLSPQGMNLVAAVIEDSLSKILSENKYAVVLDKNYVKETPADSDYYLKSYEVTAGSTISLTKDAFEGADQLIGWATTSDRAAAGTVDYSLNQSPVALKNLKSGDRLVLYGVWSADPQFTVTIEEQEVEYNATQQLPVLVVKDGDDTLTADTDYEVWFYPSDADRTADTNRTNLSNAQSDDFKDVSDYYLKVTGKAESLYADYGSVNMDYTIGKHTLNIDAITAPYSGSVTIVAAVNGVGGDEVEVTYTLAFSTQTSVGVYAYTPDKSQEATEFFFNNVVISDADLAGNYMLPADLTGKTLTVAPKALTLTPQNIELTYGDAVPGWAQYTEEQLVTGDNFQNNETLVGLGISLDNIRTYLTDGTGFGTTRDAADTPYGDAVAFSDAGKIAIETALTNYQITWETADLTVNPAKITAVSYGGDPKTISKDYDGTVAVEEADLFTIAELTYDGLVDSDIAADVFQFITDGAQVYENANAAASKTVTVTVELKTGVVNYILVTSDTDDTEVGSKSFETTGEITAIEITAIAIDVSDMEQISYNASDAVSDDNKALIVLSSEQVLQDDDAGFTFSVVYTSANAGTKTVTVSGLGVTNTNYVLSADLDADDYTQVSSEAESDLITPATISAVTLNSSTFVYDGEEKGPTTVTISFIGGAEPITTGFDYVISTVAGGEATDHSEIGTYYVNITGFDSPNYALSDDAAKNYATFEIVEKAKRVPRGAMGCCL